MVVVFEAPVHVLDCWGILRKKMKAYDIRYIFVVSMSISRFFFSSGVKEKTEGREARKSFPAIGLVRHLRNENENLFQARIKGSSAKHSL